MDSSWRAWLFHSIAGKFYSYYTRTDEMSVWRNRVRSRPLGSLAWFSDGPGRSRFLSRALSPFPDGEERERVTKTANDLDRLRIRLWVLRPKIKSTYRRQVYKVPVTCKSSKYVITVSSLRENLKLRPCRVNWKMIVTAAKRAWHLKFLLLPWHRIKFSFNKIFM